VAFFFATGKTYLACVFTWPRKACNSHGEVHATDRVGGIPLSAATLEDGYTPKRRVKVMKKEGGEGEGKEGTGERGGSKR